MIRRAGGCMRTAPEAGASREGFERTHSEVWQRVIRSLPLQQGRFPFMGQETGMPFPDWTPFPLCAMEVVRAWETGGFPEPPRNQASPTRNTTQNMFFPNPLLVFITIFWTCFEFLVNQVQGIQERNEGRLPLYVPLYGKIGNVCSSRTGSCRSPEKAEGNQVAEPLTYRPDPERKDWPPLSR